MTSSRLAGSIQGFSLKRPPPMGTVLRVGRADLRLEPESRWSRLLSQCESASLGMKYILRKMHKTQQVEGRVSLSRTSLAGRC